MVKSGTLDRGNSNGNPAGVKWAGLGIAAGKQAVPNNGPGWAD